MGPLLFIIYTTDLSKVVKTCKIQVYVDDTQIYSNFNIHDVQEVCNRINVDLKAVYDFSVSHNLKLNANKTFFMLFGSSKHIDNVLSIFEIKINNNLLPYTAKHKNLGITFDTQLRFVDQVSGLVSKSYRALKLLYANKHMLSVSCSLLIQLC